jgi:uncharacterized RDD family membrane protein YckC
MSTSVPPPEDDPRYIGLVTRGIAFALEAALIDIVALVVGVGAALILSLLHLPSSLKPVLAVIGGAAFVLWSLAYFIGFWSATGQTPGSRVMQIRVIPVTGDRLKPRRCFVRCIGLLLAALPLFADYLMIPFNTRRRGFQDLLARTVVFDAPQMSIADLRRAASQTGAEAARQAGAAGQAGVAGAR